MVRSMAGQGCLMTRKPPEPSGTGLPSMVDDFGHDAGKRTRGRAGLGGDGARERA